MSEGGYISVRNWRRFQHYDPAVRVPPWIKVYTELMADQKYLGLSLRLRGILTGIWLEYAAARSELGSSPAQLGQRLGDSTVRARDIESLVDAGFIEIVASAALAEGYQGASASRAREEQEQEEDTPYPAERGNTGNGQTPRARGENPRALGTNPRALAKRSLPERQARRWIENGLAAQVPSEHLEEVIADEFGITDPELAAELATEARGRR